MVQVLLDFRHLARVRLLDVARTSSVSSTVRATFEVSSRLAPRSRTFSAVVPAPANTPRREVLISLWLEVLNNDLESIRRFVYESARLPSLNEPLDMYPLGGDDDVDKIDASLVTGTLDGSMLRPGTLTSDQIDSLDASKLTGKIDPERLRGAGITFDMVSGTLCGSRIQHGTLDHRHIASVDARTVFGTLSRAELPPNSVHDHHITSVSWDRVIGTPTDEVVSGIRLENLGGRLRVDQLPSSVPPDRVDFENGLDLSLFTRGRLPVECLPDGVIEARHIRSVSTAALVGELDGGTIAPGSVPSSAIVSIDAGSVVGDLDVDSVETHRLTVTGTASIGELMTSGSVTCAHVDVCEDIEASGDATVEGAVACVTLDAAESISAHAITCREVDAARVRVRDVDADRVHASTLESDCANTRELHVETAVASDLDAETVSSRSMHVDMVAAEDVVATDARFTSFRAESLEAERASFGTCTIDRTATFGDVDVAGDLDVGSTLLTSTLGCCELVGERVTVAGPVDAADLNASRATVMGTCSVTDTLEVADRLEVAGELRASDMRVDGPVEAERIACDRIAVDGSCVVGGSLVVAQSSTISGPVVCNTLTADAIESASVRAENVTVSDAVNAEKIVSEEVAARNVDARTIDADVLAVNELEADRVVVESEFNAKDLRCGRLSAPKIDVTSRLDIGDSLACRDLSCSESLEAERVYVTDTLHADKIESGDDIVISGVSVAEKLREMEDRVAAAERSSRAGRPLVFPRREFFADTQYDAGHDTLDAISPAFPLGDPISYDLPDPSSAQGLSVTSTGDIVGRGNIAGTFPIAVRASIKAGSDTHALQIDAAFTVLGPPTWLVPETFEVVRGSAFDVALVADNATGFEGADPVLDGVGVQGNSLVGVLTDVGVYPIGAVALRALGHNDHVLRSERTFEALVRPPAPVLSAGGFVPGSLVAGGTVSIDTTLVGTDDNATVLEVVRTDGVHDPVVWVTDASISTRVGDFEVPLSASGAVAYAVVTRGTLPLSLALTGTGILQGTIGTSTAFTVGVRASGSGGAWRPADEGGHADRVFEITVRPPAVDLSQLDGDDVSFAAGVGVVIEAVHSTFDPSAPHWYSIEFRAVP